MEVRKRETRNAIQKEVQIKSEARGSPFKKKAELPYKGRIFSEGPAGGKRGGEKAGAGGSNSVAVWPHKSRYIL